MRVKFLLDTFHISKCGEDATQRGGCLSHGSLWPISYLFFTSLVNMIPLNISHGNSKIGLYISRFN